MNTVYWIVGYVVFLNVYLYWLMGKDKEYARRGQARIPERHFFMFSALGGALGTYLAMFHHHHKTKHKSFRVAMPIMIAVHVIIAILIAGVLM